MTIRLRALLALGVPAALLAVAAVLVAGFVWTLAWTALHGGPLSTLVLVLGGLLAGAAVVGLVRRRSRRQRLPRLYRGVPLLASAQPRLWNDVRLLAERLGTRPPDEMWLIADARVAVTQDSSWLGLVPRTRRLYLGVPLLVGLSRLQLHFLVAHDLAHYGKGPFALDGRVYAAREAVRRDLEQLPANSLTRRLLGWYDRVQQALADDLVARRELEADRLAAAATGRDVAIGALRELAPITAGWAYFHELYADLGTENGRRPADLFEGFGLFLADPDRQRQLAAVREAPLPTHPQVTADGRPHDADRLAALRSLPEDGVRDGSGSAFSVMEVSEPTLVALQDQLYERSGLQPATWDELAAVAGATTCAENSADLLAAARRRGLVDPTLADLLNEFRSGRAAELVEPLARDAKIGQQRHLAAVLLGDLVATLLLRRDGAVFRLDWGGPWRLVAPSGEELDPWVLASEATRTRDGVTAMESWLLARRLDLQQPLDLGPASVRLEPTPPIEAAPPAAPAEPREAGQVLARMAPVSFNGMRALLVLDTGLLLKRPEPDETEPFDPGSDDGLGEWMLRRLEQRPLDALLADGRSEFFPWDRIGAARLERIGRSAPLLTLRLTDGAVHPVHLERDTVMRGEPLFALRRRLGDRFTVD